MSQVQWAIHGREFANCNCSYGCPCQFNALPTYGNCSAVVGIQIDRGFHGTTVLDGLRLAASSGTRRRSTKVTAKRCPSSTAAPTPRSVRRSCAS